MEISNNIQSPVLFPMVFMEMKLKMLQNPKVKVTFRWLLILFYLVGGVNHFVHPEFYDPHIPPYLPYPDVINYSSGTFEVIFALGVMVPKWRKWAVIGIILMLIAFVPAHIYFIQAGACMEPPSLCTPVWVAWVRLFPIHPLLMWWAWVVR